MVCLYCGAKTSVINSRPQKRLNHIWRRRQCDDCMAVFTTSETPDYFKGISVVSKNGLQPFSRDKLFICIHSATNHRKTSTTDASHLTDTIISMLSPKIISGSLQVQDISSVVLKVLRNFDNTSAVAYSAYHPEIN